MMIKNETELRDVYGLPSGRARKKSLSQLDKHAIDFIGLSPFFVLSTFNKTRQVDTSPRGGQPGFVHVLDSQTIAVPDAKGNNRIDSLVNITETGRVGTLFFVPGVDETLRVNGSAYVSNLDKHLSLFNDERVKTCIIISVEEVFLHCAKALMRSGLWHAESQVNRSILPTMGQMLKDQIGSSEPAESQEEMIQRYQKDL